MNKIFPYLLLFIVNNMEEVDYFITNHFLSKEYYDFNFYKLTAGSLTIITHRINETLDGNFIITAIALSISKAFGMFI